MARLLVTLANFTSAPHELNEELITIGRGPNNMIQIEDPSVSDRHAQLQRTSGLYRLKDLASTNGTRINDQTITEVTLRAGDRIRFGRVEARFEGNVSRATQPLPELAAIESKPAETSARPADLANASPFPNRKKDKDPIRVAVLAAAGVALLVFLGSMIALLTLRAPIL